MKSFRSWDTLKLARCGEILRQRAERVYVMPGNHETVSQIESLCQTYGLHNFHEQQAQWGRYHVAGLGYSNITPFDTPGEYTEEQLVQKLEAFAGLKPLVLICHCPPKDTALDRIREGLHAGSPAVRDFVLREQPAHFFCGHIHEAAGQWAELGQTRGLNVGKQGYVLELE